MQLNLQPVLILATHQSLMFRGLHTQKLMEAQFTTSLEPQYRLTTNRLYVGAPGYRNSQASIIGTKGTVGCVYGYDLPLKSTSAPGIFQPHHSLTVGWRASFGRVWIQYGSAIRPRLFGCWRTSINFKYECETGGVVYVVHNISAILWGSLLLKCQNSNSWWC